MTGRLSARLRAIADALPLRPGMRVLEIGCGPGAAAKAVLDRLGEGHILGVDRAERAIAQAGAALSREIAAGRLSLRHAAIGNFELAEGEPPYDLAFAIRVGALDGRHPEVGDRAMLRIAAALAPGGRLFIDGGDPLRELRLPTVREAC